MSRPRPRAAVSGRRACPGQGVVATSCEFSSEMLLDDLHIHSFVRRSRRDLDRALAEPRARSEGHQRSKPRAPAVSYGCTDRGPMRERAASMPGRTLDPLLPVRLFILDSARLSRPASHRGIDRSRQHGHGDRGAPPRRRLPARREQSNAREGGGSRRARRWRRHDARGARRAGRRGPHVARERRGVRGRGGEGRRRRAAGHRARRHEHRLAGRLGTRRLARRGWRPFATCVHPSAATRASCARGT